MQFIQIGWFLLGVFQWFAIVAGLEAWFGIPTFFAFIISLFITCIPFIGTIAGFKGAIDIWGWSFYEAGALFFGPLIILIFLSFLYKENY